ncbi:MAG: tail fiber domain-containing protein, partial [Chthoniobacterales bacterium]
LGSIALYNNTTGTQNTATGVNALWGNTTGSYNTATGNNTLYFSGTGNNNTATGVNAMTGVYLNPITGSNNTANGSSALLNIISGSNNIALGANAGQNVSFGSYNIDIGHVGFADEANTIRIGTAENQTATFIAGIRGTPISNAVAIGITVDGQLGVRASSARFKEAITPMDKASEAIFSLQPVMFRYKKALDPQALPQFGLVAEQVAKVNPDLVARDNQGKPYTVRYEEVNAMLLNEFLKEHRKVEEQGRKGQEQEATITELKSTVNQQQEEMKALTETMIKQASQIQKVNDQLELSGSAPRAVADDQ